MSTAIVRTFWRLALVSVFWGMSVHGFSQFSDSVFHYFGFSGTGNINNTNAGTAYIFNNAVKFNISKKQVSINTFNGWIYGENNKTKTNNDFTSTVDVDLFKNIKRFYYWGLAGYERSFSLKIDNRLQAGAGVGYKLVDRENASLTLTDGILYETTGLPEPDQYGRTAYQTVRNSFRVKFRFAVRDVFTVEGTDFLQNSLADGKDYIIRSNTAFTMKVYKWLGVTVGVAYNKMNLTSRENFLLNYGLTAERYF